MWHTGVGCGIHEWGVAYMSGVWHTGVGCGIQEWGKELVETS